MRDPIPTGPFVRRFMQGIALCGSWALLGLALAGCSRNAEASAEGCSRDADCKGSRICMQGACTDPQGAAQQMEPAPQPQPQPQQRAAEMVQIHPPAGLARAIARMQPSFSAPEAGRVPAGENAQVIEKSADGLWYHVRHTALANQNGWIERDVLIVAGGIPAPHPVQAAVGSRARRVSDPPGGCEQDGVIYDPRGRVYGCSNGGNWCASMPPLPGGCPR